MKHDYYKEHSQIKGWVSSNYGYSSVEEWIETGFSHSHGPAAGRICRPRRND